MIELIQTYPRASIIFMALAISFLISLVNFFFLDKERMREIKAKQKSLNKEISQHRKEGNHEKMMEIQKELIPMTMEMFKHSLKPMIITIIPILVFFAFIRNVYVDTAIASTWIWYYFISTIVGSIVFRKIFKLP